MFARPLDRLIPITHMPAVAGRVALISRNCPDGLAAVLKHREIFRHFTD